MPKVVLTPEHRGQAWAFLSHGGKPPKDSSDERWVLTGENPGGYFREHASIATLVAAIDQQARKAEREACAAHLERVSPQWADSGGDWALHSVAGQLRAGEHAQKGAGNG